MQDIGGRKFVISIILVCIATIAMFINKATFTEWATFSGSILGLYGTGNVWGKYLEKNHATN